MQTSISHTKGYMDTPSENEDVSIPTQTKILLGSSGDQAWPLYEIYASEITKIKYEKSPTDTRPVILCIALKGANNIDLNGNVSTEVLKRQREVMKAIMQSVQSCAVW